MKPECKCPLDKYGNTHHKLFCKKLGNFPLGAPGFYIKNVCFKCKVCGLDSYSIFCYSCSDILKWKDKGYEDLIRSYEKLYET